MTSTTVDFIEFLKMLAERESIWNRITFLRVGSPEFEKPFCYRYKLTVLNHAGSLKIACVCQPCMGWRMGSEWAEGSLRSKQKASPKSRLMTLLRSRGKGAEIKFPAHPPETATTPGPLGYPMRVGRYQ